MEISDIQPKGFQQTEITFCDGNCDDFLTIRLSDRDMWRLANFAQSRIENPATTPKFDLDALSESVGLKSNLTTNNNTTQPARRGVRKPIRWYDIRIDGI